MNPKMMNQPPRINVSAADADGIYSNVFFVAASRAEFILDFARIVPGVNNAKLMSRIIVSPHRMKALVKTLESQINSYESKFGKLDSGSQPSFGFQNPAIEEVESESK